jgi:diguanylate cyclase (GGDEF)-like protein
LELHQKPSINTKILFIILLFGWIVSFVGINLGVDSVALTSWSKVQYSSVIVAPFAWLLYSVQFARINRWNDLKGQALFAIIPSLLFLLVWVSGDSGISQQQSQYFYEQPGKIFIHSNTFQWLYPSFYWFYYFLGASLIIYQTIKFKDFLRRRSIFAVIGVLLPVGGYFVPTLIIGEANGIDITPLTFIIGILTIEWGVIGIIFPAMLDKVRDHQMNNLKDGLIVLDNRNRIVYLNQVVQDLCSASLNGKETLQDKNLHSLVKLILASPENQGEYVSEVGGNTQYYKWRIFHLEDEIRYIGGVIVINDNTEVQQLKIENQAAREELMTRGDELRTLRIFAETLNQLSTLEETIQSGLETLLAILSTQAGWLVLIDQEGTARLEATYRLPPAVGGDVDLHDIWPECECMNQLVAGELTVPKILKSCSYIEKRSGYELEKTGHVSIPLHLGRGPIGVLNLVPGPGLQVTEGKLRLFKMIGDQYSAALVRARLFNDVQQFAILDSLTGTYNRRHFHHLAEIEFERARRYEHPLSVIMLDLDKFKRINDTYGHSFGDQVLSSVVEMCQQNLRIIDIMGRYGGEEFVILLPETDIRPAYNIANRLCIKVRNLVLKPEMQDSPVPISASFGVAKMVDDSGFNIDRLLDRADQALYMAKEAGRDQVVLWEDIGNGS